MVSFSNCICNNISLILRFYFATTYNPNTIKLHQRSVLELRAKWGVDVKKNGHLPSPSLLYQRVSLCIFCMQFFDVGDDRARPCSPKSGGSGKNTSPTGHIISFLVAVSWKSWSKPCRRALTWQRDDEQEPAFVQYKNPR